MMRTNFKKITPFVVAIGLGLTSCTKLDVPIESEITPDNFPVTQEDFTAISGAAYTFLHYKYYTINHILMQELSGDGAILTANGGNWYDDGRYQNYHLHQTNGDQRFIKEVWTAWYNGISKINSLLPLLQQAQENSFKTITIAEMRALRAYFYYLLMDDFGGVPLVTEFGANVKPVGRSSRSDVFDFIEQELLEALPNLRSETGVKTYSKPTKWMAYSLLAKLYLNSEVYTGTARYNDAILACDMVIEESQRSGSINLEADYLKMFDYDNGPQIKEFIFTIPCDPVNNPEQIPARYWLHGGLRSSYQLPYTPSGSLRALPKYYELFSKEPQDVRNKFWLVGKQYYSDGSPVIIKTTKKGMDNSYTGADGATAIDYHLEFTPDILFRDLKTFETGNDELGRAIGYRVNKFRADPTSTSRNQNNDQPIFRYADILLMKAESILRGGQATMGHTALELFNKVRSRSKASSYSSIDLQDILDERAREFAFEGWRRNDLIRFGKFEQPWGVKTSTDIQKRVFPIPTEQIKLNPLLEQNPSY
ncbi:RagB/SusD family nutrient uptake outer membrane protein [Sphingobacterium sp. xlx-130]|uniref:RagB/SusD family nutrient uptake outer membrane protein n=1 Tax=Sphingobacterium sp. xlx-130 TaxID=2654323 RepID=UPI0013DD862B|nr:RagB/SusD family nutrient uptake outer membrane protein [Sphingobacterium sp. xlx-130]